MFEDWHTSTGIGAVAAALGLGAVFRQGGAGFLELIPPSTCASTGHRRIVSRARA